MLYHYGWRKKKANYIIPATYFKKQGFSIAEKVEPVVKTPQILQPTPQGAVTTLEVTTTLPADAVLKVQDTLAPTVATPTDNFNPVIKVSAFSIKSIAIKKELAENQKSMIKATVHLPVQDFTETQMLEQWYKYAQRLEDKGHKIMMSLLNINEPTLEGATIIHELPNEGSKIDFEREMHELLGYLRGKLHNHDIKIIVRVNEAIESKKAYTAQDKYNRMVEINPNLEVLKKLFDLEI
ncbi:MAG: DNA polymerase III subunit gamma/tau [Flavobacterium sp.]